VRQAVEAIPDGVHSPRRLNKVRTDTRGLGRENACELHSVCALLTMQGLRLPQPAGPSSPLGRGKAPAVELDAEKRDHRMDNNAEYYQHSAATTQFQKVAWRCSPRAPRARRPAARSRRACV